MGVAVGIERPPPAVTAVIRLADLMIGDTEFLHAPADVAFAHVFPFLRHLTCVRGDVRRAAAWAGRRDSSHTSRWPLDHGAMLVMIGRWRKPPAGSRSRVEGDKRLGEHRAAK
jgi:hypothetical protein